MTLLRWYILVCLTVLSKVTEAQDIHWSQYNDNQVFQNPGNAGNFNGDYRIIANYRSQWKSVTIPFNTLSFSGDTRFEKNQNLGLGLLFFNDAAGDGKFQTTELQFNTSYKLILSKDSSHSIRPGINFGINHRQVNWDKFSFDNQYNGAFYDPTLPTNETYQNQRNTNFSFGIGGVHEFRKNERKKWSSGIGFYNLNRPNQGFFGEKVQRDVRISLFTKASYQLSNEIDIQPSFCIQIQGKYKEIIGGSNIKYILQQKATMYQAVYAGLWLRAKDSGYLSVGMDYQNWFLGISYDFNISKLTPATNFRGGIEFAARYIIKRFKPKKITHRICPDYI